MSAALKIVQRPLTALESRKGFDRVKARLRQNVSNVKENVAETAELCRRDAWKALSYPSWETAFNAEFKELLEQSEVTYGHFRRLVRAEICRNEIKDLAGPCLGNSGNIPETHCRELNRLDNAEAKAAAFREATAGGTKNATASDMKAAVDKYKNATSTADKLAAAKASSEILKRREENKNLRDRLKKAESGDTLLAGALRKSESVTDTLWRVRRLYGIAAGGKDDKLDDYMRKALVRSMMVQNRIRAMLGMELLSEEVE